MSANPSLAMDDANAIKQGIEPPYSKALSIDNDEKRATKPIAAPPPPPPPPMPAAATEKHSPPAASDNPYWTVDGLPLGHGSVMGEPLRRAQWDSSLFACLGRTDEFCSSDL
ncbi:Cell number regulator 8 [Camellia lanceoleosa]|uniref:Cell number regulator 8 n=1 Tax=Camellia lanceoleosa TaxID=1840588 RepID=A0ACC0HNB9_9ERIC|nr:Cell number regulator 8 [Camellia lanceoleosa]